MIYLVSGQQSLFELDGIKNISVEESIEKISKWPMVQYDSETDGKNPHLCKLLCIQFGDTEGRDQVVVDTTTVSPSRYKELLENKYIIGHNLKFDLQFLYNYGIIPRKVYDTMIVEQLLYLGYPSGQISYSLQAVALRRLNKNVDKSIRGQIIWRGLDESVINYAAYDVVLLYDIMQSQIKECKEKECLVGAKLECDVVPAMAYLEWCGIKLDETKWKAKMQKDKENLDKSLKALNDYCISNPKLQKWVYVDNQLDLFAEFDPTPKFRIDWQKDEAKQVFKTLGFKLLTKSKITNKETDSVQEKNLKAQKGIDDKFLSLYFDYQGYYKVTTSFGQGHANSINPITGRLYTNFWQLGAASGRMSCGSGTDEDLEKFKKLKKGSCPNVNLQQLPSDEDTRACFVAEEGNLFCSCDWSAIESRLGGDIYNEKSIINEFLYGSGDMHSLVAKMVFPELKDVPVKDIKKLFPEKRKAAKPIEFSQQFGGSEHAIKNAMGCSDEEAIAFKNAYDTGFPGIAKFKAAGSVFVRNHGYVLLCKVTGHKMYWWDWNKWIETKKKFTSEFWENYRTIKEEWKRTEPHDFWEPIPEEIKIVTEHFQASSKWDRMALNGPTQGEPLPCIKPLNSVNSGMRIPSQV